MRFPVDGDIKKLTARYYQFGDKPYDIAGEPVINPDGSYFGYKHHGSDIDVPVGIKTYAPENSVAEVAGWYGSAGNAVILRGKTGKVYLFHMDKVVIKPGQTIRRGQLVGYSGKTGYSRGVPHIHFGLEIDGKWVDPLKYIEEKDMVSTIGVRRIFRFRRGVDPTEKQLDLYVGKVTEDQLDAKIVATEAYKAEIARVKADPSLAINHVPKAMRS